MSRIAPTCGASTRRFRVRTLGSLHWWALPSPPRNLPRAVQVRHLVLTEWQCSDCHDIPRQAALDPLGLVSAALSGGPLTSLHILSEVPRQPREVWFGEDNKPWPGPFPFLFDGLPAF
jgi:hypothetical protein